MRKLKAVFFYTIVCALLCAGCMPKMPGYDPNFRYNPENVNYNMSGNLSLWWAPMDFMVDPLNRAITKFNKQFPNIKINVELKTRADYFDEFNLTYVNNTTPDIVRLDHVLIQSLGESKRVIDLSEMTDDKVGAEESKYIDKAWDCFSIQDSQYGFPFESSTTLFMYNEKICKEVFGENYQPPKNYQELKYQSLYVKNNSAYKGFIMPINASSTQHDIFVLNGWLARFGAKILSDDRKSCLINTPEGVEAFARLQEMMNEGVVDYVGYSNLENAFIYDGKVAFIEMGSWIYNDVKDMDLDGNGESDIKVCKIPVQKEGFAGYSSLGVSGLTISSACKNANKPAAYEFIKFLSTDYDTAMDFAKSMKVFPSLKDCIDDEYYTTGDADWVDYWSVFIGQLADSVPRPGTKYWPDVSSKLKRAENLLSLGGIYTPEKVARDIKAEIDKLLV